MFTHYFRQQQAPKSNRPDIHLRCNTKQVD